MATSNAERQGDESFGKIERERETKGDGERVKGCERKKEIRETLSGVRLMAVGQ